MTNTTAERTRRQSELEKQLEPMVDAHVAVLLKAAQGAVERGFAAAFAGASAPATAALGPRAARAAGKRRAKSELSAVLRCNGSTYTDGGALGRANHV